MTDPMDQVIDQMIDHEIGHMIARRVRLGNNHAESENLIHEILEENLSPNALAHTLVYESFATERQAEKFAKKVCRGYICKRCGEPSPMGVGYPSTEEKAILRSPKITSCPCGYSRKVRHR